MAITFRKQDFVSPEAVQATGKIVIAVDGPAASGKSTLARKLAERLGYAWLNTGGLYRAVGWMTMEMGGNPADPRDAMKAVALVKGNLTPELLSSAVLRSDEASAAASKVAVMQEVRLELLDFQRDFAQNPPGNVGGAILDGRDIGTVVCPKADIKLFVTASPQTRAQRRYDELKAADPSASYETILQDLIERDARDSTRKVAPLVPAEDAYVIDTSKLNIAETVEEALAVIRSKFLEQTGSAPSKKQAPAC